ncbi:hypothetical protein [Ferrimonas senticii]|uniref:hypothetical protein n=1 Tax=Ferrimonas senticii TaxID=394566 RepID=UPI0003FAF97F|nr:hypothetical protein [Ferrimonas senticii]
MSGKIHRVACCQLVELKPDLFEVLVDNGAEITLEDCQAFDQFWQQHCPFPFDILVDANREYSYSFGAALSIGSLPQQRFVAVYSKSHSAISAQQSAVSVNQLNYPDKQVQMFAERSPALNWLEAVRQRLTIAGMG